MSSLQIINFISKLNKYTKIHQINQLPQNTPKMIANVWQLDELPFLKVQRFPFPQDQPKLLQNMRSISFKYSSLMSKLLLFEQQIKRDTSEYAKNKLHRELIVITEKQLYYLKDFYQIIRQAISSQQQFSSIVSQIQTFEKECTQYFGKVMKANEIDYQGKKFLNFGIYMLKGHPNSIQKNHDKTSLNSDTKLYAQQIKPQSVFTGKTGQKYQENKKNTSYSSNSSQRQTQIPTGVSFVIKCSISNFKYKADMNLIGKFSILPPKEFQIQHSLLSQRLWRRYRQLESFPIPINPALCQRYLRTSDLTYYALDQEHLKLQVYENYPLLRTKFYIPIRFNDFLTKQRLDGPIFSNADPECMYGHFTGYNADSIKQLEASYCQQCRIFIDQVQQNELLTNLRDSYFNPQKLDVLYNPEWNRFKIIKQIKQLQDYQQVKRQQESSIQDIAEGEMMIQRLKIGQQQTSIPQTTQIIKRPVIKKTYSAFLNYLHMRVNIRKLYTKKRNKYISGVCQESQRFPLSFKLWGRNLLISDPVRGRNCSHYSFTDMRLFYLNKVPQNANNSLVTNSSTYECPICGQIMPDSDIIYLREVQVLLKYLKLKTKDVPQLYLTGQCFIDHFSKKVSLLYKYLIKEDQNDESDLFTTASSSLKQQKNKKIYQLIKDPSNVETKVKQINEYYATLIDPYIGFSEYKLGIQSKHEEKLKQMYMFGGQGCQNEMMQKDLMESAKAFDLNSGYFSNNANQGQ